MEESSTNFTSLMRRFQDGDESAAQQLVAKYGEHIIRVVRRRLDQRLRPLFDSTDFVQAVWASFFAFAPERHAFDRPEQLMAFLTSMAQNKVVDAIRGRLQGTRQVGGRDVSLSHPTAAQAAALAAPGPTPDQIAMARDEWRQLLRAQPTQYQRILDLLRDGESACGAAKELGLNERTVRRVIHKIASNPAHERD